MFDLGVRMRMEKLDPTEHKVYEGESNCLFGFKGICSSKVLKLRRIYFQMRSTEIVMAQEKRARIPCLQRCRMDKVWVDIWKVSSVQHCLWRVESTEWLWESLWPQAFEAGNFPLFFEVAKYAGEILERNLVERNILEWMLVERKCCYLGGNVVHTVSKENKQCFHFSQNTESWQQRSHWTERRSVCGEIPAPLWDIPCKSIATAPRVGGGLCCF